MEMTDRVTIVTSYRKCFIKKRSDKLDYIKHVKTVGYQIVTRGMMIKKIVMEIMMTSLQFIVGPFMHWIHWIGNTLQVSQHLSSIKSNNKWRIRFWVWNTIAPDLFFHYFMKEQFSGRIQSPVVVLLSAKTNPRLHSQVWTHIKTQYLGGLFTFWQVNGQADAHSEYLEFAPQTIPKYQLQIKYKYIQ